MLKFVLNRGEIVLDKNIVLLDEFNNILKYGAKKKDTDKANNMLMYVYLCCDLSDENLMKDIDFRQKPIQAKTRVFKDKNYKFTAEEEKLIDAAMDAYNFFNEGAAERSEIALDKKIDEARSMLETTKVEIVRNLNAGTGAITFSSNDEIITRIAKQIDILLELKLKMKLTAVRIQNTSRVKGNKGSSMIERGAFDAITDNKEN